MKCVKHNDGKIVNISDSEAKELVNNNKAEYIPRKVWKKEVRGK